MPLPEEKNPYLRKFGFRASSIPTAPDPALRMAVVIPCFDESDMTGCLESLWACEPPDCAVEVMVVVNDSEKVSPSARERNTETLKELAAWQVRRDDSAIRLHVIESLSQPPKHAGVGLSRKIGMDEAVRRFDDAGAAGAGIIVCFDADCRCDSNYLRAIEGHFVEYAATPGCSIYFEHPLDGGEARANAAIAAYELHLRYYIDALRYAGFPSAYQTVGSCMAVRSWAYQKQGGMNRRQAGEDFYFLHRIIQLGGFTELNDTRVIPSPRASHRVPFGTGKAVGDMLARDQNEFETYPFKAFEDLRAWFGLVGRIRLLAQAEEAHELGELSPALRSFLASQEAVAQLAEMRAKTTNEETFNKRFFSWFNAFRVMKFIHHARDDFYGSQSVESGARALWGQRGREEALVAAPGLREVLESYRAIDRRVWAGVSTAP
ncbi:MAG: hypothetical protein ACI9VS_001080 [Candidatus Binatia bacterium]|jgi:hypothetical protein